MFQHACRLFDEAAPRFGVGPQDLVELALADDDMHFAAHSGIAQQFLDVQQPALLGVDGIFRAAIAEQGATDGHLGVFDR